MLPEELELWEAVLAEPEETAPRLVLADLLQQRGEPYGLFLQAANSSVRVVGLPKVRKALVDGLFAPLCPPLSRHGIRWERGLLDTVKLTAAPAESLAAVRGHPLWGTVRHVRVSGASDARVYDTLRWLTGNPSWRWLESVRVAAPYHLDILLERPAFGLHELRVDFATSPQAAVLADPRVFPQLRRVFFETLVLHQTAQQEHLGALFARPLEWVGFGLHPATFAAQVQLAKGARAALRFVHERWQLDVHPSDWRWRATALQSAATRSEVHGLLRRLPAECRQAVAF